MRKQDFISDALRASIRDGLFPVGSRIPSQVELADRFNTSIITVNKAVGILVEQGYLVRAGNTRSGTIVFNQRPYPQGFLAFIVCFGFGTAMLKGAIRAAEQYNYMLVPFHREMNYDQEGCLKRLHAGRFCGFLTTSRELFDTDIPSVYMDTSYHETHPELYEVRSDTRHGGRLVADALLRAGHRDIVYCSFWPDTPMTRPRREGFFEVLASHGGISDLGHRFFTGSEPQLHSAKNLLRSIMSRYPGVTALSCWNDSDAILMRRAGQELGVDVGTGITLTGFGNIDSAQAYAPFATIEQFPEETGYRACVSLIKRLEHPDIDQPHLEELEVGLLNADRIAHLPSLS